MQFLASRLVAAALFAMSLTQGALAVTYNWVSLTTSESLVSLSGSMVFDDQYWLTHEGFSFTNLNQGGMIQPAGEGLLSFNMIAQGPFDFSRVRYYRFLCGTDIQPDCTPDKDGQYYVYGRYDFQITFGGVLTGSLFDNDSTSDITMSSTGPVWAISRFSSDGGICFIRGACNGGTGLWVLDLRTVPVATPVPEPETAAMWLAGMFLVGVALCRDRRPRKCQ